MKAEKFISIILTLMMLLEVLVPDIATISYAIDEAMQENVLTEAEEVESEDIEDLEEDSTQDFDGQGDEEENIVTEENAEVNENVAEEISEDVSPIISEEIQDVSTMVYSESFVADNDIQFTKDIESDMTRNTVSSLKILNGVETGSIKVTIEWGKTDLTNQNRYQYREGETGGWKDSKYSTKELDITENKTIYARFFDGSNSVGTIKRYTISQVDNQKPAPFDFSVDYKDVTKDTATIFATVNTDNITDNFGNENLRYEYKISSDEGKNYSSWTTDNEFKDLAIGKKYYIMARIVDKAGNERLATNIQICELQFGSILSYIQSSIVDKTGKENSKGEDYSLTINGVSYSFDVIYLTKDEPDTLNKYRSNLGRK